MGGEDELQEKKISIKNRSGLGLIEREVAMQCGRF